VRAVAGAYTLPDTGVAVPAAVPASV
jgi:hypothetical protein